MLVYILKFSACLGVFLAFYKLFLERENMHQFKRYYLIGIILASITIPFVTFTDYIEPQPVLDSFSSTIFLSNDTVTTVIENPTNYLPIILWSIYGLGMLLFGLKFGRNLIQLIVKIKKNPKQKASNFINVLLKDLVTPHTFFSYIFLNKHKYETHQIPEEVLLHEQTHAKQKHSIDVLFIEVLQIIFWFNPLVYFIKNSIKLNHEFLADEAVLNNGVQPKNYQNILLAFSANNNEPQLANAINYSSIKKRITVMKTQTSKTKIWLRSFILLPLLALALYSFSEHKEVVKDIIPEASINDSVAPIENSLENLTARSIELEILSDGSYIIDNIKATKSTLLNLVNTLHQDITPEVRNKIMNIHISSSNQISNKDVWHIYNSLLDYGFHRMVTPNQEIILSKGNTPFTIANSESEASLKELAKVNAININYSTMRIDNDDYYKNAKFQLIDSSGNTITKTYDELTPDEKSKLLPAPKVPQKNPPSKKQLSKWLDSKQFGVWLDGNRIKNNKLTNYRASDFRLYYTSKLEKNAINYGKHYFQVNLYSNDKFNEIYKDGVQPLSNEVLIKISSYKNEVNNQDGASRAQMKEYEKLAKHYNSMPDNQRIIKQKDVERMKYIYHLMSDKQKKDTEPFPNIPPPPAPEALNPNLPPPPPPPIPDNATKEQKEKYKKVIEEYNRKYTVKNGKVSENPPPPPPPIPANATPTEKARMKKVAEAYAKKRPESVSKTKLSSGEVIEVVEIPMDDEGSTTIYGETFKYITKDGETTYFNNQGKSFSEKDFKTFLIEKEKNKKSKQMQAKVNAMSKQEIANLKKQKEAYKNRQKLEIAQVRELQSKERALKLKEEKLAYKEARTAKMQAENTERAEARLKLTQERQKLVKQQRVVEGKLKQKNEKLVGQIGRPEPPKSPLDHVIDMAKKDALFYLEGKKINSDKAIETLKKNKNLNIETIGSDSNRPKVYITKEPIVIGRKTKQD